MQFGLFGSAAAQDLEMPLSLHILTERRPGIRIDRTHVLRRYMSLPHSWVGSLALAHAINYHPMHVRTAIDRSISGITVYTEENDVD